MIGFAVLVEAALIAAPCTSAGSTERDRRASDMLDLFDLEGRLAPRTLLEPRDCSAVT